MHHTLSSFPSSHLTDGRMMFQLFVSELWRWIGKSEELQFSTFLNSGMCRILLNSAGIRIELPTKLLRLLPQTTASKIILISHISLLVLSPGWTWLSFKKWISALVGGEWRCEDCVSERPKLNLAHSHSYKCKWIPITLVNCLVFCHL